MITVCAAAKAFLLCVIAMRDMLQGAVGWICCLRMNPSYSDDVQELCDYTLKRPRGQTVNDIFGSRRGGQWVAQEKCAWGGG